MRDVNHLWEFYPGIYLTTEEKARKTLIQGKTQKNLSRGKKKVSQGLEDRDIWNNIKMDLEEIGLEVTTEFEYRSEQSSSACLRCHSQKPLDFVRKRRQFIDRHIVY
jgi:hypothetical protein